MAKGKGCGLGKTRYPSWRAATKHLLKLQKTYKGPEEKKPKKTYYCFKCRRWHLTSREF